MTIVHPAITIVHHTFSIVGGVGPLAPGSDRGDEDSLPYLVRGEEDSPPCLVRGEEDSLPCLVWSGRQKVPFWEFSVCPKTFNLGHS